jgi:carbonic anhydrase/acetyltransferase-like protein (isoleucine patch superfamily)
MRKIGAICLTITALAAVVLSPLPAAAFGLHLGPFHFGLPHVGHHYHRHHQSMRANPREARIRPNDIARSESRSSNESGSSKGIGAQVIAEGGSISIGRECIIMENSVLRSSARHSLSIANNCLIGPNAHVVGCTLEDEVFIATGAAVFHAARVGKGSEVRINAVVHLKTHLAAGEIVPIGWIAVGNPAQVLPPSERERIWHVQKPLDFPLTVYGIERDEATMRKITHRLSEVLRSHASDEVKMYRPS